MVLCRFGWTNLLGLPMKTRPSLMNCLRFSLRNSDYFNNTLSPSSGMSIICLQQATNFSHSRMCDKSRSKDYSSSQSNQAAVSNPVESRKMIEPENDPLDVSDTNFPKLSNGLSQSGKNRPSKTYRDDTEIEPRQNELPGLVQQPFGDVDSASQKDGSFISTPCSELTSAKQQFDRDGNSIPDKGSADVHGRGKQKGRCRRKNRMDLGTFLNQMPNKQHLSDGCHEDEGLFTPKSDGKHKDQSFSRQKVHEDNSDWKRKDQSFNGQKVQSHHEDKSDWKRKDQSFSRQKDRSDHEDKSDWKRKDQSFKRNVNQSRHCSSGRTSPERRMGAKHFGDYKPFDICKGRWNQNAINPSVPFDNDFESVEFDQFVEGKNAIILMPGMVLLKKYIPLSLQVNIALRCREIGIGNGGFYQPGYEDGAKLRLHMMCLGLDWDPQTRKYSKKRTYDNTEPPNIPHDFSLLVNKALQDSHSIIKQQSRHDGVEEILPMMDPDICIVNFYSNTGRLGLHQDRDESKKSISKGLPVVSFSIGDTAEFLYGVKRDVDEAEKVLLESGDVLIFGGDSRLVFHGVASVLSKTAPKELVEQAKLSPGRLNLTFRKY